MHVAHALYKLKYHRGLLLGALVTLGTQTDLAQGQILHSTGDRPSFEVASIKPWKPMPIPPAHSDGTSAPSKVMKASPVGGGGQPTNRVHMILPLSLLIASAYNLPVGSENRLVKGPGWLRQDLNQYEIQAKIADSLYADMQKMTPAQQREQVALMEQSLLADRFKLKVHFEMEEMPVYALVSAKGGPKLTPAKDSESSRLSSIGNVQGMTLTAVAVTLNDFALSPLLNGPAGGRLIVDQTGLKGLYDFTLQWQPEQFAASDSATSTGADAPSLFTAIQDQLGLRLVPSKARVEVIIIDHVEPPSAN